MDPKTFDNIERYILGLLSEEELVAFEKDMLANPELKGEVLLQKEMFGAIKYSWEINAFKEQLEAADKKLDLEEQKLKDPSTSDKPSLSPLNPMLKWWIIVAVIVAVILAASWWLTSKNSKPSPGTLFAEYFSPPQTLTVFNLSRTASPDDTATIETRIIERWNGLWGSLQNSYNEKNFYGALATLDTLKKMDSANNFSSETYFWSGVIHLRLDEPETALEDFNKVKVSHNEDKAWYSALSLLSMNRVDEARKALYAISQSSSVWKKMASDLLEKL